MAIAVQSINTVASAVYTSVGASAITSLTLCNYSPGDVTASVFMVPEGYQPDVTNIVLSNVLITSGDTLQMYVAAEKVILGPGDAVYASASISSTLSVVASYTQI